MDQDLASDLLTVAEGALKLRLSESNVRKMVRTGTLPHYRLGSAIRLRASDLDEHLERCRRDLAAGR